MVSVAGILTQAAFCRYIKLHILGRWLLSGEFRAARFFNRLEFHELDSGIVRIVEIQLPFAVASDFRLFGRLPAVLDKLVLGRMNVSDAKRNVIHDTDDVVAGIGRDIEHVFEPVGAVGHLHGDPTGLTFRHATLPVKVKAEDIFVKAVFRLTIADDDARMNQARAGLAGSLAIRVGCRQLHEGDDMAFGVLKVEVLNVIGIYGNGIGREALGDQIPPQLCDVRGGQRNLCDQVRWRWRWCSDEFDLLMVVDHQASGHFRTASGCGGCKTQRILIEVPSVRNIGDDNFDARNSRDRRPRDLLLRACNGDYKQGQN